MFLCLFILLQYIKTVSHSFLGFFLKKIYSKTFSKSWLRQKLKRIVLKRSVQFLFLLQINLIGSENVSYFGV